MYDASRAISILVLSLALGACEAVALTPIEGGGTEGTIAGELRVVVVDARDGARLGGAEIEVDGDARRSSSDGAAAFAVDAYDEVIARSPGYRTERWLGADAAELTLALAPLEAPTPARVEGTIEAGGLTPTTPEGSLRALVSASRARALDASGPSEVHECAIEGGCPFELAVAPGELVLFAQIVEVDASGGVTPRAVLASDALALGPGERAAAVALFPLDDLVELRVEAPALVEGVDAVVGVPGVAVGDEVLLFPPLAGGVYLVPRPEGSTLWAVGHGEGPSGDSRSVTRLSPGASEETLRAPELLPLGAAARTAEGIALPAAPLRVLRTDDATVRVFDERASVALGAGALGAGAVEVELTDVARGPTGWRLADVERGWQRRARSRL